MPTVPKLVSAVAFAIAAYFAANAFALHMPEGSSAGWLRETAALVAALVGWFTMAGQTGRGYFDALGGGLKTILLATFWVALIFSIYLMIRRSMHGLYSGPMDAVLGVFQILIDQIKQMQQPDFIGIVLLGGCLAGVTVEWAGRRWQ